MFSYGSGLASTIFSFKIREGQHPFTISNIAEVMDLESKLESRNEVCFCILLDICDIIIMLRANLKHFKYVFFQDNRCSTIFKIICSFNFIIWASRNQEQHYLTNVAESEIVQYPISSQYYANIVLRTLKYQYPTSTRERQHRDLRFVNSPRQVQVISWGNTKSSHKEIVECFCVGISSFLCGKTYQLG